MAEYMIGRDTEEMERTKFELTEHIASGGTETPKANRRKWLGKQLLISYSSQESDSSLNETTQDEMGGSARR